MRIKVGELREIIREVLEEQGTVPGKWNPISGEPLGDDEVEGMGSGGLGIPDEEDGIHELRLMIRGILSEEPGITNDPTDTRGFYDYDIERGTDIHSFWYKSPGRGVGGDGDPGRVSDPAEYIGFKTPGTTPEDASEEMSGGDEGEIPSDTENLDPV